jgi:hypothetical protein
MMTKVSCFDPDVRLHFDNCARGWVQYPGSQEYLCKVRSAARHAPVLEENSYEVRSALVALKSGARLPTPIDGVSGEIS